MRKTAEEDAFGSPSEIDTRAFLWTFDSLDEDHELERFFSGLPGFRSSKMVKDPLPNLTPDQQGKLLNALVGLLDRTTSSDLLPELAKIRRTVICVKAIGPAGVPRENARLFSEIVVRYLDGLVPSVEIARSLRGWANGEDEETAFRIRAAVWSVVVRAQRRDVLWFAMAADEIGVPESVLRNHATHGNDLSLAILIHIVLQQFSLFEEEHWPYYSFWRVLEAASKFDVLDTSPELQHEFCALWNEVTRGANYSATWYILRPIRNVYLTLHLHTDSAPTAFSASTGDYDLILDYATTYPLCNVPGHHSHSTPHTHDVAIPTVISHAVLPGDVALVPSSLASTPDAPSPSVPTAVNVDNNPMDVLLLENISVPASLYRAHQTATESVRDSATSPDPAAASAAGNSPSARTMPSTTRETSTCTSSVPPPAAVSLQNNADLLVYSSAPELPSSASPEPVLGTFFAVISPGTSPGSPWPASAPGLDTAEGGTKPGSGEENNAIDHPSDNRVIQEDATVILDLPSDASRLPPPSPHAPDTAAVGPSQPE